MIKKVFLIIICLLVGYVVYKAFPYIYPDYVIMDGNGFEIRDKLYEYANKARLSKGNIKIKASDIFNIGSEYLVIGPYSADFCGGKKLINYKDWKNYEFWRVHINIDDSLFSILILDNGKISPIVIRRYKLDYQTNAVYSGFIEDDTYVYLNYTPKNRFEFDVRIEFRKE